VLSFTSIGVVAVIVYLVIAFGRKRHIPIRRQLLAFVLFVYLLGVIAETLFPIPVSPTELMLRHISRGQPFYNLVPFTTIRFMIQQGGKVAFINLAGNVVLFIPFGFLIPLVFKNLNRASRIIPLGFAATFMVESCQLLISYTLDIFFRSFDVDDMILNTLGVIVGYVLLRLCQAFIQSRQETSHILNLK
jgi:glycopeptide antibiotics resistance protein